jgi:hypothetical protein
MRRDQLHMLAVERSSRSGSEPVGVLLVDPLTGSRLARVHPACAALRYPAS